MGKLIFLEYGDVQSAPAALVYLTDENGEVVMASSEDN